MSDTQLADWRQHALTLESEVNKVVVGQHIPVRLITTSIFERGHVLLEGDVGVGKTIEAILILRELLERGTIKSFAVLCPPHLCEQWQKELVDKLDIEAVIIRSSTVAGLERKIIGDDTLNVFNFNSWNTFFFYVKK